MTSARATPPTDIEQESAADRHDASGNGDAVVDAARRGEADAWERIYRQLGRRLTRYATSRGVADAEDVTQEVMYAAARQIQHFSGDWNNLRSWLFTIAYRRCADHHRRMARTPEQLTDRPPDYPASDAGADRNLFAEGEAREAFAALDILDEREQRVVTLRVIDELSTRDVAEILGLSHGNVRVIQARALTKMRRYLAGNGGYLDRRFRGLAPPVLAALDKMQELGRRASAWLGEWVGTVVTASAAPRGGAPHAAAAVAVAVVVTAGGMGEPAPSPAIDARPDRTVMTAPGPGNGADDGMNDLTRPPDRDGDNKALVHRPPPPGTLTVIDPATPHTRPTDETAESVEEGEGDLVTRVAEGTEITSVEVPGEVVERTEEEPAPAEIGEATGTVLNEVSDQLEETSERIVDVEDTSGLDGEQSVSLLGD